MKKNVVLIFIIILLAIAVSILYLYLFNAKRITNYRYGLENKELRYGYREVLEGIYERYNKEIVFCNDKENNRTYIKINLYNLGLVGKSYPYHYDNVIKGIYYNRLSKKVRVIIDYTKLGKVKPLKIDDMGDSTGNRPDDTEFYLTLYDIQCNKVELDTGRVKLSVNEATNPLSLFDISTQTYGKYATIESYGKYGLVDKSGNVLIDFISEKSIDTRDNLAIIRINKLDYLSDINGNIISEGYENLEFNYKDEYISIEETDPDGARNHYKYGLMNKNGEVIAPIVYGDKKDIDLNAKFRFEKNGDLLYPTDLNGNRLNNNSYTRVEKTVNGYYIGRNEQYEYVLISPEGEQLSELYTEKIYCINEAIPLFESGLAKDRKIIDKNGKVRMERIYIDENDKKDAQPKLYLNEESLIDNVPLYSIFDRKSNSKTRLISITDDSITIEMNGIQKTVKNGKIQ